MMELGSGACVLRGKYETGKVRGGKFGSDGGRVALLLFRFLSLLQDGASASLSRLWYRRVGG